MDAAPAGISNADWLGWPANVRALIRTQQEETLALRQENEQLRAQLTALATERSSLRERIGLGKYLIDCSINRHGHGQCLQAQS
jgi:hypothetical protein